MVGTALIGRRIGAAVLVGIVVAIIRSGRDMGLAGRRGGDRRDIRSVGVLAGLRRRVEAGGGRPLRGGNWLAL
jgi:hypothetical protein